MRISNLVPAGRPAAQPQRTGSKSNSFGKQLDIAARENLDRCEFGYTVQPGGVAGSSPYCRLMDSYNAWKARQSLRDLPDSWGPTEENLAYLKEHYSGDLSWEERVDALETMVQMGVITPDQRNSALGGGLNFYSPAKTGVIECITVDQPVAFDFGKNWDEQLKHFAASSFKTADDLFAWLDRLLEQE